MSLAEFVGKQKSNGPELPRALVVFGTGPHNDYSDWLGRPFEGFWKKEVEERQSIASDVLSKFPHAALIAVGGETWVDSSLGVVSEAGYMIHGLTQDGSVLEETDLFLAESGVETVEQVDEILEILRRENLTHGAIGVVTSWHQMLRTAVLFKTWEGIQIEPHVAGEIQFNRRVIEEGINGFGGLSYTVLMLGLQNFGLWEDGGPYLLSCRSRRRANNQRIRDSFQW